MAIFDVKEELEHTKRPIDKKLIRKVLIWLHTSAKGRGAVNGTEFEYRDWEFVKV
jgi:hypothetical protein